MIIASATAALPSRKHVAASDEALLVDLKNRKPHLSHLGDAISMIWRQPGQNLDITTPPPRVAHRIGAPMRGQTLPPILRAGFNYNHTTDELQYPLR